MPRTPIPEDDSRRSPQANERPHVRAATVDQLHAADQKWPAGPQHNGRCKDELPVGGAVPTAACWRLALCVRPRMAMMPPSLVVIVLHDPVLVSDIGFCRGATSSASYNLRAAPNGRTAVIDWLCQRSSRRELFCFRAGCASDTLSEQRGGNKQAFRVQH